MYKYLLTNTSKMSQQKRKSELIRLFQQYGNKCDVSELINALVSNQDYDEVMESYQEKLNKKQYDVILKTLNSRQFQLWKNGSERIKYIDKLFQTVGCQIDLSKLKIALLSNLPYQDILEEYQEILSYKHLKNIEKILQSEQLRQILQNKESKLSKVQKLFSNIGADTKKLQEALIKGDSYQPILLQLQSELNKKKYHEVKRIIDSKELQEVLGRKCRIQQNSKKQKLQQLLKNNNITDKCNIIKKLLQKRPIDALLSEIEDQVSVKEFKKIQSFFSSEEFLKLLNQEKTQNPETAEKKIPKKLKAKEMQDNGQKIYLKYDKQINQKGYDATSALIQQILKKKGGNRITELIKNGANINYIMEDGSNLADFSNENDNINALKILEENGIKRSKIQQKKNQIDTVSSELKNLLQKMDSGLNLEDSIKTIKLCIDMSRGTIDGLKSSPNQKKGIAIIGCTGAGKSTSINYFNGCTMVQGYSHGKKIIKVKPKQAGGAADPITNIGHQNVSMTFLPVICPSAGNIYIDCPGLFDTRGAQISIANAVNIRNILQSLQSLTLIVLFDGTSLLANRGIATKAVVNSLCKFFGNKQNIIQNSNSILIGITKLSKNQTGGFSSFQAIINQLTGEAKQKRTEQQNIFYHLKHNIFTFDPLNQPMQDGLYAEQIKDKIKNLQRIKNHKNIMQTVLTEKDNQLLTLIGGQILENIKKFVSQKKPLKLQNFQKALQSLNILQELKIIKNKKIFELEETSKNFLVNRFQFIVKDIEKLCFEENFEEADNKKNILTQSIDLFSKYQVLDFIDLQSLSKYRMQLHQKMLQRLKKQEESRKTIKNFEEKIGQQKKSRQNMIKQMNKMHQKEIQKRLIQAQTMSQREKKLEIDKLKWQNQQKQKQRQKERIQQQKKQKQKQKLSETKETIYKWSRQTIKKIQEILKYRSTKLETKHSFKRFHQNLRKAQSYCIQDMEYVHVRIKVYLYDDKQLSHSIVIKKSNGISNYWFYCHRQDEYDENKAREYAGNQDYFQTQNSNISQLFYDNKNGWYMFSAGKPVIKK